MARISGDYCPTYIEYQSHNVLEQRLTLRFIMYQIVLSKDDSSHLRLKSCNQSQYICL